MLSVSQCGGGSVFLRLFAAILAELLYPPGRERLWEVTIGSLDVGAAVAVGLMLEGTLRER